MYTFRIYDRSKVGSSLVTYLFVYEIFDRIYSVGRLPGLLKDLLILDKIALDWIRLDEIGLTSFRRISLELYS